MRDFFFSGSVIVFLEQDNDNIMDILQIIEREPNLSDTEGLSEPVCHLLQSNGISVERMSPEQAQSAFENIPAIKKLLSSPSAFPISIVNGHIALTEYYPDRRELTEWFELDVDVLNVPRCCCGSGRRCCWCGRYYIDGKHL